MIRRNGALALGAALLAGACAPAARTGPPQPVVSPTGHVYPIGTPPTETRLSQTATLYLRQGRSDRALELALEGVAADTANPIHYFLAGTAYARLGRYAEADRMLSTAERIYPAYELDVEPERAAAWAAAFNLGVEAYDRGDTDGAIAAWSDAASMYDLRPEAHHNLGSLLAAEGRFDEAIGAYQGALEGLADAPATRPLSPSEVLDRGEAGARIGEALVPLLLARERYGEAEPLLRGQLQSDPEDVRVRSDLAAALTGLGRDQEARAIYATLLSESDLQAMQLFNLGVALFRAAEFTSAAEAFGRLTTLQPESRDAWYNYANSLLAAQDWSSLATAGSRLVELDPLGESSWLITARAHLEVGDREAALLGLERAEAAPVYVEGLRMRTSGTGTTVEGRIAGNVAESGTPVHLSFTFFADDGAPMDTRRLTVTAPAPGESVSFDVSLDARAASYRYALVR